MQVQRAQWSSSLWIAAVVALQAHATTTGATATATATAATAATTTTCDAIPVLDAGQPRGSVCAPDAAAQGLTVVDLGDHWTPLFLRDDSSLGAIGEVPWRSVYVALENERFDDDGVNVRARSDRFFEPWGIWPSLTVLRARLHDDTRHACHAAVHDGGLAATMTTLTPAQMRGSGARRRSLARMQQRVGAHTATLDEVRRLHALRDLDDAVHAVRAHLVCDGLLPSMTPLGDDDEWDSAATNALAAWQRREALWGRPGVVDDETRLRMLRASIDRDALAVLRMLRERVVDATGLLEDGSATGVRAPVIGEVLDAQALRVPLPARATDATRDGTTNASDLIDVATDAAARALGASDVRSLVQAVDRWPHDRVALLLPPGPSWHSPAMDLHVTLDRGDVDDDGLLLPGATRKPMLVIEARNDDGVRVLVRWPTTIGGRQREKTAGGIVMRDKPSPTGAFVWRLLWAQPAWYAPPTTPDDELLLRTSHGVVVNDEGIGPGYRSAYGIVMLMHDRMTTTRNGPVPAGTGVRTHGTGNVRSVFVGGPSHGCHRLLPMHAQRLATFLLQHRTHRRDGPIHETWERTLHGGGHAFHVVRTVRGVRYELTPPVPVDIPEQCIDDDGAIDQPAR